MTSGGLRGTQLSTNTNVYVGDKASNILQNPPFVIAFVGSMGFSVACLPVPFHKNLQHFLFLKSMMMNGY
jgi:hypothetical protein